MTDLTRRIQAAQVRAGEAEVLKDLAARGLAGPDNPYAGRQRMVDEIEARVRPTICTTLSSRGETIEGRVSEDDFETLLRLARGLQ